MLQKNVFWIKRLIIEACIVFIFEVPLLIAGIKLNISGRIIATRLLFLFFLVLTMIEIVRTVHQRWMKYILSPIMGVVLFVVVLIQCLEFYNFFMQEDTFNYAFYMSMFDIPLIKEQLPHQIKILIYALVYISAFVFVSIAISIRNNNAMNNPNAIIIVASLLTCIIIACFTETSFGNFVAMIVDANESRSFDNKTVQQQAIDYSYFESLGITACNVGHDNLMIESNGIQKNLVFIILESVEANFLDDELFPGLTPNLNRFRKDADSIVFSNMDQYAGHTAESMFQTFWGFPSTPAFCSSSTLPEFSDKILNNFCSLPYIFYRAGYTWEHIQSPALANFERALSNEGISFNYLNSIKETGDFGQRDKDIFEYAWNLFREKDTEGKHHFAISISTIDCHTPNGIVDKKTLEYPNKGRFPEDYSNFQLLNAVYTTDHYLGVLVDNILKTKTGKDTVIAIMNDHRFMGTADGILNKKKRNNIFMILNAGEGKEINERGCQIDIAPTMLDFFNIQSNYVFPCGVSLLHSPIKEYSLRTLDSKRKRELSKLAYMKMPEAVKTRIISINKENPKLIDVFGTDVPNEIERGWMYYITFTEGDSIDVVDATLEVQTKENMIKGFERILKAKYQCIFLFQPGKANSSLVNMLYEKIGYSNSSAKYALVYRDNDEHYISSFADYLDDLFINLESDLQLECKSIVKLGHSPQMQAKDFSYLMAQDAKEVEILEDKINLYGTNYKVLPKNFLGVMDDAPIICSLRIKNNGNIPIMVCCGFAPYNKDLSLQSSGFEKYIVVRDAPKESDSILVQGAKLLYSNDSKIVLEDISNTIPNCHSLSSQITGIYEEQISPGDVGPMAVPACIKCFDPTAFSKISLSSPLSEDIKKGSIICLAPSDVSDVNVICDSIVLQPGQESIINWNIKSTEKSFMKPLVTVSSTDGKSENNISIFDYSIINF